MENTIMTEKIARRGIITPDSYEPDVLGKVTVGQVIKDSGLVLSEENEIGEVREWLEKEKEYKDNYFIIVSNEDIFRGIVSSSNLFNHRHDIKNTVETLIRRKGISIRLDDTLRKAVELMTKENIDVLPVLSNEQTIIGVLTHEDILSAYKMNIAEYDSSGTNISIKRNALKMFIKGQKLISAVRKKD